MTDTPAGVALERINPSDLDRVARLGLWLAAAESGSNDPNALGAAAALRIAYAEHLGLPAHAAQDIHIIKGNLTLSARLKRALAHKHGLHVELVEEGDDFCTAAVVHLETGRELGRRTYTLEQAQKAGIANGVNWTKQRDRMLWARASSRVLDDFAPWVTVGVEGVDQLTAQDLAVEGEPLEDDIPFGEVVEDES